MSALHVVTGAGPVGSTIALHLAGSGTPVRLLTRSGSGPDHPLIERRAQDASGDLSAALEAASVVYHCAHPAQYTAKAWRRELPTAQANVLDAAGRAGAVVVFPESLYGYGTIDGPITEGAPAQATGGKLGVRAALIRDRLAHATPNVSVAASDFFGPRVRTAHAGERMVPRILAGRTLRVLGSADQPHTWTYVPDLAAAMIRAGSLESTWGALWHAPSVAPLTQRQLIEAMASAAEVPVPAIGTLPSWLLRTVGIALPAIREIAEVGYQFDRPFVMDSRISQEAFDLAPTPMDVALRRTVAWWRDQPE